MVHVVENEDVMVPAEEKEIEGHHDSLKEKNKVTQS